jgi:outer membrane lipopolysaccharide assembly protein LptE/RlpB
VLRVESGAGPLDSSVLRELHYGYGSLTENRTLVMNLRASDEDAAGDVASVIESGMALRREELRGGSSTDRREWMRGVLDATTVDQAGRTAVVRSEHGGEAAALAVAVAATVVTPERESASPRRL